ncbi:hypothetical protein GEV27_05455 [Aeromicrobium sp. S22]|uniref:hypothetical protein n=1 Tax=Aeromicrobium sp. S22 TaxID=2662029 RepID=UPI00129E6A79|nr:hypothetical protein [Aeromicrobium sp. S22]MRK00962.1 hypothetical protein [Aeromicrobium sp. S22]
MRSRLYLAPWWVQALTSGVFFGAAMAIWEILREPQDWGWSLVGGVIGGMIFGSVVGWGSVRDRTRWRRAAGSDLSDAELLVVYHAEAKGPIPSDPRLRLATVRAARYRLEKLDDDKWVGGMVLVLAAVMIWLQFRDSLWWLIAIPLFTYACYGIWAEPRRLRARIEVLSREVDQAAGPSGSANR